MSSLPKYFPVDKLKSLPLSKVNWFYSRYVEEYYPYYTFGHFIMAAYAAVPALLTPDLLYKIWLNFNQYQWRGKPLNIHRIAVSDVLLAPFCKEVGFELYEMEDEVRNAFLEWLELASKSEIWANRQLQTPYTIAQFLQEYQRLSNPGTIRWGKGYDEAQTWNNWLIINPEKSQELLLQKVKKAEQEKDELGMLRAMDFWAKAKGRVEVLFSHDKAPSQWSEFKQNATFAEALKAQMQGNNNRFGQIIQEYPALKEFLSKEKEGGFEVKLSKETKETIETVRPVTVFAAVIGINDYSKVGIYSMEGCINDGKAFASILEGYAAEQEMPLEMITLFDEAANRQALTEVITHFRQARNGDICVLYYAGHTHYLNLEENKGRQFILYDSTKKGEEITQNQLEEWLYPLLIEKEVPFLMVLDTHEAEEQFKKDLAKNSLRKNAQKLKGSLVILNAGRPGEPTYERVINGQSRGAFTYNLEKALKEGGFKNNYRQLMELARVRMLQNQDRQTPFIEAFPPFAENNLFLTNITDAKMVFQATSWVNEGYIVWRINGGKKQGITPSLNFMPTELALKDGTKIRVKEVDEDYATLFPFEANLDIVKTYEAVLLQTALPKIKVAYDTSLDPALQAGIEAAIEEHDIYYIDLVDDLSQAQYFIRNREETCYLSRKSREQQKADNPIFKFESSSFELIKQMEYIAQWTGILEFNRNSSFFKRNDISIQLEALEGIPEDMLDSAKPTRTYTDAELDLVQIDYKKITQDWLLPAFRCTVINNSDKKIYINALYLDSQYGIIDFGSYELPARDGYFRDVEFRLPYIINIKYDDSSTIYLNIDEIYIEAGKTEIIDYLKLFIADKPMDTIPILQESLNLESQNNRKGFSQEFQANTFDIAGIDWTAITIPIKITQQEEEAKQQEERLWEYAFEQKTFESYEDYLKVFPNGRWAEIAREKLEGIIESVEEETDNTEGFIGFENTVEEEAVEIEEDIETEKTILEEQEERFKTENPNAKTEPRVKGLGLDNFTKENKKASTNQESPKSNKKDSTISNLSELKHQLKDLVLADEIKNALELFKKHLHPASEKEKDIILLTSRFNAVTRDINRGIVTRDQANRDFARIRYALTSYIEDLAESDVQFPDEKQNTFEASATSKLSDLEQRGLIKQAELLQKRINRLRRALALETDPSRQFKYEEEIIDLEAELTMIKEKLS